MSDDKPAILQESTFTVEEGVWYRFFRTGAIWLNKLFFGAVVLLAVWLLLGLTGQIPYGCADSIDVVPTGNGTVDQQDVRCSVWLSPTAKYLGAMSIFSFVLSVTFGLLGLVVGKNIFAVTPTEEEVGAAPPGAEDEEDEKGEQPPSL